MQMQDVQDSLSHSYTLSNIDIILALNHNKHCFNALPMHYNIMRMYNRKKYALTNIS